MPVLTLLSKSEAKPRRPELFVGEGKPREPMSNTRSVNPSLDRPTKSIPLPRRAVDCKDSSKPRPA